MIGLFKRWFRRLPNPTGRYWNLWEHQRIDSQIGFSDFKHGLIAGYMDLDRIVVGDEIRARLNGGVVGRFIVTHIRYIEPGGSFFGRVERHSILKGIAAPEPRRDYGERIP